MTLLTPQRDRDPSAPPASPTEQGRQVAAQVPLAVALLVIVGAEVLRAMFPLLYLLGEDRDFLLVGLVALAVYAAPALATVVPARGGRAILGGGLAVVIAFAVVTVADPIPAGLAMTATAVTLVGATLALGGLARLSPSGGLDMFGGLVLGLAADSALRAPGSGYDLVWNDSPAAFAVAGLLAAATVAALVGGARLSNRVGRTGGGDGLARRVWPLGPYLMLQLLFLHNAAYVASQAGVSAAAATSAVLCGDALTLAGAVLVSRRSLRVPAPAVVAGAFAAALLAGGVADADGWAVVALVMTLQILTGTGLVLATTDARPLSRVGRRLGGLVTGVAFLGLALLWQLDIDRPLPFPRTVVPIAAILLVGGSALRSAWTLRRAGASRPASPPSVVPAIAVTVASLAIVVPAALPRGGPDRAAPAGGQVRLVSYNVRGALDVDGQLRPDAIAREIRSSDPDVVILQEVARGWPIFGAADLLADLARRLDMTYRWEPAADGQFGNAVLTRLPVSRLSSGRLPSVDGKQDRSWLAVTVDVAGRELTVVDGHLESRSPAQIDALLAAWGGRAPAVIAGDFNVKPHDPEVARFAGLVDAVASTGDPCRTTSAEPTSDCDRPDWLFVTPDVAITDLRIGTAPASDHLPIHAGIRLSAGN